MVAVPSDHIQRRMSKFCGPEGPLEFLHQFRRLVGVLETRSRHKKIAGGRQSVGAERRKPEKCAVIFTQIAAYRPAREFNTQLDTPRDDGDLSGSQVQQPK